MKSRLYIMIELFKSFLNIDATQSKLQIDYRILNFSLAYQQFDLKRIAI